MTANDSNSTRRRTVLKSVGVVGTSLLAFSGSAAAHEAGCPFHTHENQGQDQGQPQGGSQTADGEGAGKWARGHGSGGWAGKGYERDHPHRDDETRWDDWEPGDGRPPWAEGDGEDEDEEDDDEDEDEDDPEPEEPEEPEEPDEDDDEEEPDEDDEDESGPPENPGNGGDDEEEDEDEEDEDEDEEEDPEDPEEPDEDDDEDEDDEEDEEEEEDEDEDPEESEPEPETVEGQIEARIHAETNDYRDEDGLDPLEFNGDLAAVAREHSEDMLERGYFDHTSPEGDGPGDRLDEADVDCLGWAENIAYEFDPGFSEEDANSVADSIVQGWVDSAGHEQNIVGDYDSEGVGVAVENNTILATQMFCSEGS